MPKKFQINEYGDHTQNQQINQHYESLSYIWSPKIMCGFILCVCSGYTHPIRMYVI